jgi:transcriptional regulator with XRE-family HTH domain
MIERIVGALGYPMLGLEIARLLVRAAGNDGNSRGDGRNAGDGGNAGDGDVGADIARADPADRAEPTQPPRPAPPPVRACAGLVGVFALGEPASAAMTGEETGRALRLLRQVRGWSQRQAAEASGLARSALSAIERGKPPGEPAAPAALAALAGRMGLSAPSFDLAGLLVRMGRQARQARPETPDTPDTTPESAGESPAPPPTPRAQPPSAALCARAEGLERPGLRLGLVIFDEGEGAGGQRERPHPAAVLRLPRRPRLPGS